MVLSEIGRARFTRRDVVAALKNLNAPKVSGFSNRQSSGLIAATLPSKEENHGG
jgi:hypothetical protein